jgi:hypothetical protein
MKLTFESRPAYAYVAVGGPVDVGEAATLREAAAEQARLHETMRLMLDLRDADVTRDARDQILIWARAPHASASALVTLDELFVAEVNMAALASGARVRGFPGSSDAHRWLTRGSMVKTPYDGGSGRPPPVDAATRRAALHGTMPPRPSDRPPSVRPSERPPLGPRPGPSERSERPTGRFPSQLPSRFPPKR